VLSAVAALLLTGGCAPQLDRIEVGVQENADQIAELQAENRRLQQEMAALAQLLRMESQVGSESTAMRVARLTQISDLLEQVLRSQEDNARYMRDISARVDMLASRSGVWSYNPDAADDGSAALAEEGRSILEAAELDRTMGNTDLARAGYMEFLEKYGQSEAADKALYGLGDVEYSAGNHELALTYFRRLVDDHPASAYAPGALHKTRSCLLNLGRQDEAWAAGGELLAKYPDSDEAALLEAEREENR
jgi:TolA-binding protein